MKDLGVPDTEINGVMTLAISLKGLQMISEKVDPVSARTLLAIIGASQVSVN